MHEKETVELLIEENKKLKEQILSQEIRFKLLKVEVYKKLDEELRRIKSERHVSIIDVLYDIILNRLFIKSELKIKK